MPAAGRCLRGRLLRPAIPPAVGGAVLWRLLRSVCSGPAPTGRPRTHRRASGCSRDLWALDVGLGCVRVHARLRRLVGMRGSSAQPSRALGRQRGIKKARAVTETKGGRVHSQGSARTGRLSMEEGLEAQRFGTVSLHPSRRVPTPIQSLPGRRGPRGPASASASSHGHPPRKGRENLARDPCKNRCIFG